MPARPIPHRHWRSYGDHPLPIEAEALDEPLRAFRSWFLGIVCGRCGEKRIISKGAVGPRPARRPAAHMTQSEMHAAAFMPTSGG